MFTGQHPDQHGWPGPGVGPFEPFTFAGVRFPAGVAAGTGKLWTAVAQLLIVEHTPGGLYCPDATRQLTNANAVHWEQYGQNTRKSRNSGNYSIHSWGLAVDFNSGHNPNQHGIPDRGPWRLPANTQQLLDEEFGQGAFAWGGQPGWASKGGVSINDWMHVEAKYQPADVADWNRRHSTVTIDLAGKPARAAATSPAQPTPPTAAATDPLEFAMTLPGAPAGLTYQQFCKDIANAVAAVPISNPSIVARDPHIVNFRAAIESTWQKVSNVLDGHQ